MGLDIITDHTHHLTRKPWRLNNPSINNNKCCNVPIAFVLYYYYLYILLSIRELRTASQHSMCADGEKTAQKTSHRILLKGCGPQKPACYKLTSAAT